MKKLFLLPLLATSCAISATNYITKIINNTNETMVVEGLPKDKELVKRVIVDAHEEKKCLLKIPLWPIEMSLPNLATSASRVITIKVRISFGSNEIQPNANEIVYEQNGKIRFKRDATTQHDCAQNNGAGKDGFYTLEFNQNMHLCAENPNDPFSRNVLRPLRIVDHRYFPVKINLNAFKINLYNNN